MGEAAGLIGILRNDPFFPKRLKNDLHEVTALWFYKQQNFDSAVTDYNQRIQSLLALPTDESIPIN